MPAVPDSNSTKMEPEDSSLTECESGSFSISSAENKIVFCTFVAMGNSALAFCTFFFLILNPLTTIIQTPFPGSLLATYTTVSFCFGVVFLVGLPHIHYSNVICASVLFSLLSFFFCFTLTAIHNRLIKSILVHMLSGLGGGLTFLFQRALYIQASKLPRNYMGAISLGFGLSGLFLFVHWLFFSEVCYPSPDLLHYAIWCFALTGVVFSNILGILLWKIIQKYPWTRQKLQNKELNDEIQRHSNPPFDDSSFQKNRYFDSDGSQALETHKIQYDFNLKTRNGSSCFSRLHSIRGYRALYEQTFNISFTLMITFILYPNTAPFAWNRSKVEYTLLMVTRVHVLKQFKSSLPASIMCLRYVFQGIFLLGDFLGRYIPNVRHWYPRLVVKAQNVVYLALLRVSFVPWILLLKFRSNGLLGIPPIALQFPTIFLFSLSNGWLCSLSNIYIMHSTNAPKEQEFVFTVYLLCLLGGISLGTWLAPLI